MRNVIMRIENDKLLIEVDLKAPRKLSTTGKSMIIASTEGNVPAPQHPEIKVGVNIYTPRS